MFKFENLDVWKKAVELYEIILDISNNLNHRDQFSLGEQLRRASLSISTNIAEGTGRKGAAESKHFFNIAKGSVYEVASLLFITKRRKIIKEDKYQSLYKKLDDIARMLTGLLTK